MQSIEPVFAIKQTSGSFNEDFSFARVLLKSFLKKIRWDVICLSKYSFPYLTE